MNAEFAPPESTREQSYNDFVALLARNDQSIRRFVRSLLASADGVDDVIQETALECWRKFADFGRNSADLESEFVRWACVIARYKALSWQRDKARDRLVFSEGVIERLAGSALKNLDRQEVERQAIEACLSQMPDDQRHLVLSVYSPGQSIARIATETGQKARRLYNKVNALRRALLRCLQNRLSADPAPGLADG